MSSEELPEVYVCVCVKKAEADIPGSKDLLGSVC